MIGILLSLFLGTLPDGKAENAEGGNCIAFRKGFGAELGDSLSGMSERMRISLVSLVTHVTTWSLAHNNVLSGSKLQQLSVFN